MPDNLLNIHSGSDNPAPNGIWLRAGPLAMLFESGDLRYIRLGEREIVRRIYAAVRDQNWGTVPNRISDLLIDDQGESFRISYLSEHTHNEIDFTWHATITGAADGTVVFMMDGEARSTFLRNRIGLCVLHPIHECAGLECEIQQDDGTTIRKPFPAQISPHQPFFRIQAIRHMVQSGVQAELRFTGDIFEMEDQRNWTDASFKTYSTPLELPYPVKIEVGMQVSQSVTLTLHGAGDLPRFIPAASPQPVLRFDPADALSLPPIGLGLASHGQLLGLREIERLRRLNLGHLRADLHLPDVYEPVTRRAVAEASALGVDLELALHCSDNADSELRELIVLLETVRAPVARWLLFHTTTKTTPADLAELARPILATYAPEAALVCGTNAYFTELNRGRPSAYSADAVCYSINPQVHAFDNASLVETFEAQRATLASAQQLYPHKPIIVTPVTLRPRFNPNATTPAADSAPAELPPQVDPRQMSLFGAAWTLGSIKSLAEGGAAALTLYETSGWRGVLETEAGSALPQRFHSTGGTVFPLYHVLADIGAFAGGQVLRSSTSDPLRLVGIVLRHGRRIRILVANLTPERLNADVLIRVPHAHLLMLDEHSAEMALRDPEAFQSNAGTPVDAPGGVLRLELAPYALARIDTQRNHHE